MGVHAIDAATSVLGPAISVRAAVIVDLSTPTVSPEVVAACMVGIDDVPGATAAAHQCKWRCGVVIAHAQRSNCDD
jgi:hypothetical protein